MDRLVPRHKMPAACLPLLILLLISAPSCHQPAMTVVAPAEYLTQVDTTPDDCDVAVGVLGFRQDPRYGPVIDLYLSAKTETDVSIGFYLAGMATVHPSRVFAIYAEDGSPIDTERLKEGHREYPFTLKTHKMPGGEYRCVVPCPIRTNDSLRHEHYRIRLEKASVDELATVVNKSICVRDSSEVVLVAASLGP